MITTYIGIGSNIERRKHIQAAISELSKLGCDLKLSTIYECQSVGFDSSPFYNLVVEMKTALSLTEFLPSLRDIELKCGRAANAAKLEPRTIDLDILLFGEHICAAKPQLPRNDIFNYAFVIEPLYELCPQLIVPVDGRTIEQIWQQASFNTVLTPVPVWF